MSKQKLLIMSTERESLRSDVCGWGGEDGDLINHDKPIGLSGSPHFPTYKTPMNAIGDGWRLMQPPIKNYSHSTDGIDFYEYEWWFEK